MELATKYVLYLVVLGLSPAVAILSTSMFSERLQQKLQKHPILMSWYILSWMVTGCLMIAFFL